MNDVCLSNCAEKAWDTVDTHDAELVVEDDITLRADKQRLRQLLENLFRNAIEHGGHPVTVRAGFIKNGAGLYIEDDGPGIPKDRRDDVFEAGYSTAEEGTGIGLSIVKEISDAHDWEVNLTDGSDGGARFEITGVEIAAE